MQRRPGAGGDDASLPAAGGRGGRRGRWQHEPGRHGEGDPPQVHAGHARLLLRRQQRAQHRRIPVL